MIDRAASRPQAVPPEDQAVLTFDLFPQLLSYMVDLGASDLHLTSGRPPVLRYHSEMVNVPGFQMLHHKAIEPILKAMMEPWQWAIFEDTNEMDFAYSLSGIGRFRVNVFRQRASIAAVLRSIPNTVPVFNDLGLPDSVRQLTKRKSGLVLVAGATGSGKSTTLAAMIDLINRERACHIMTIEDPIEFLHQHKRSVVNQRELGTDTKSFQAALRQVLRQDPDVILVGELRDLETIQLCLTAAETGHLVFGTLHTHDAPQSVDRIVDVFPTEQQEQVRVMLSNTLEGVICQQLVKKNVGTGRVPAVEVMVANGAVRNLIRENKTFQLYSAISSGSRYGMVSMDQSLAKLVRDRKISMEEAELASRNPADLHLV